MLEVTGEDGEVTRYDLQTDLVLRKEVGNARLVSGDTMIWVGKSIMSHEDSTLDSGPTRTVRVENGKRRFVFIISLDATGRRFYSELKDQVDGVVIRAKKRKIRKQLSQVPGFTPINTLKSPTNNLSPRLTSPISKPKMTPKRSPLVEIGSPQLTLPSSLPHTTKGSSPLLTSTLKSPFRSPFRKKARLSQDPSSDEKSLESICARPPQSTSGKYLSPVRSLKLRTGPTPPKLEQHTSHTPEGRSVEKKKDSGGESRRKSITGSINRRVRSLQLILDDESSIKEAEAHAQQKINSHFLQMSPPPSFFDKTARKLDMSMESTSEKIQHSDDSVEATIPKASGSPSDGSRRSTHGLLNLGNYCYMNAILQAIAVLPEFVSALQDEDSLLRVIQKQPNPGVKIKTMEQLKTIFHNWRTRGDTKRLPLQYTLSQILRRVVDGSEMSINPEPLKNVIGKKNPIFATHFQQDAHEFLLNLLTEYEQELLDMIYEITAKFQDEAVSSSPEQRSSLSNAICNGTKAKKVLFDKSSRSFKTKSELVFHLPPAKCFRAEFDRTLTCRKCGYSRKQAETFYDFSLDLPFYVTSEPEPTAEQEPQTPQSPERHCFCNLSPVTVGEGNACFYGCPKASCSYREKVEEVVNSSLSPTKSSDLEAKRTESPSAPSWPSRPPQIELETLIEKQFENEVLELTCEKCKEGREAESAYQIKSLPSVLVFHLKRFEVNPQSGALFKRSDPIIPPDAIDMTKILNYAVPTELDSRYILKSVIHHLGKSIDEGHYVADVCDANGQWIRRNDTHESVISKDYAQRAYRSQESCYMFFYAKSARKCAESGKENVPTNRLLNQDENHDNAGNSSHYHQGDSSDGMRAFL